MKLSLSYQQIHSAATRLGLRRLTDVTGLDRVGVPVFAAIAIAADPDTLSVYNGKGLDPRDARKGALLELIERRAAKRRAGLNRASWFELRSEGVAAVDPNSLTLPLQKTDPRELSIEWTEATRLPGRANVLIPANAVFFPYHGSDSALLFRPQTTGLAAGGTLTDAIERGLAEVIEQDALSLAILAAAVGVQPGIGQAIDVHTLAEPLREMAERFEAAQLCLRLRELPFAADLQATNMRQHLPRVIQPAHAAISAEIVSSGGVVLQLGAGSDVNGAISVERALTELAQSRITEIQGIREDLRAVEERQISRDAARPWLTGPSANFGRACGTPIASRAKLPVMMRQLAKASIHEVYYTDLTQSDIGVPVVRVVVPGLETWYEDRDRVGERSQQVIRCAG